MAIALVIGPTAGCVPSDGQAPGIVPTRTPERGGRLGRSDAGDDNEHDAGGSDASIPDVPAADSGRDTGVADQGPVDSGPTDPVTIADIQSYIALGERFAPEDLAHYVEDFFGTNVDARDSLRALAPGATLFDQTTVGATSAGLVEQLQALEGRGLDTPVLVTIFVGTEELYGQAANAPDQFADILGRWRANVVAADAAVRAAFGNETPVILVTLPDPTDGGQPSGLDISPECRLLGVVGGGTQIVAGAIARFEETAISVAEERGMGVVDLRASFFGHGTSAPASDRWFGPDCVRGNRSGQRAVARALFELVRN